jgi:hypothetical protein
MSEKDQAGSDAGNGEPPPDTSWTKTTHVREGEKEKESK